MKPSKLIKRALFPVRGATVVFCRANRGGDIPSEAVDAIVEDIVLGIVSAYLPEDKTSIRVVDELTAEAWSVIEEDAGIQIIWPEEKPEKKPILSILN